MTQQNIKKLRCCVVLATRCSSREQIRLKATRFVDQCHLDPT